MLIHEYNPHWVEDFKSINCVLDTVLGDLPVTIEHVGSTAIPNLAAKQIIDIDIVYDEQVEFEAIKSRLEKLAYFHNGNQGIPGREVFKRTKSTEKHEVLDFITHHLYVCPNDSEQLERHILFRDYLIVNEKERLQYQKLKYEIAEEANQDKKAYAALKELRAKELIDSIIEKARLIKIQSQSTM